MAAHVLVVEHDATCPPAHVGRWLADAGAEVELCRPYAGDAVPSPTSYDAVVVLGGPMNAYDDQVAPWLPAVRALLRDAATADVPTLGICLGHQLLAVALGGRVERNPRGQQVGLTPLGWQPAAADDALFAPLTGARHGIHWNDDVVTALPDGAVLLATSPGGEPQVVRYAERAWGVQLHPEADRAVVQSWADGDRDDHLEQGIDQDAALAAIEAAEGELAQAWRPLAEGLVRTGSR